MPSFNTSKYIRDSIDSVISQTYKNWELIIIDDCSTDNTKEIVSSYKDKRILFFANSENSGAAFSRNRALSLAKGRWIAFLDSDDIWEKEKLEKQIAFMECNSYHFSYTKYIEFSDNCSKKSYLITGPKIIKKGKMKRYCWPGCLTVMYDASFVGTLQIEEIKKNNDYAMWLKINEKEDCYLLDSVLGRYRKGRSGSISNQSIFRLIKWHFLVFKICQKEMFFQAAYHTLQNMFFGVWKKIRYVRKIENEFTGISCNN